MKLILLRTILFVLVAVIGYSGYQLWSIRQNYVHEARIHNRLMQYSPLAQASTLQASQTTTFADASEQNDTVVNQSIIDLQENYPSVVGWLTIPETLIDYPFAQVDDNDYYLHRDLDQNWSQAGTIFMDYRNNADLSDFNTIIFGHNMKNGSMFGTLQEFNDKGFFENNTMGKIFLADKIFQLDFIAFAVIKPNDAVIYNPYITEEADKIDFLNHVAKNARHYRDIGVTSQDNIITLSTCSYEFNDARMVLIARLMPYL